MLKRMVLHNFCQHADLDILLGGNLIGVIGSNGAGKSNLLNAMQFLLTGEVPGKTKEELLRWGTTEGRVYGEFEHNGKLGTIDRALHSSDVTYRYNGKTKTGARKVADELYTDLMLDKDVIRTVFVPQRELDAILFDTPSKRIVAFQKLCGVGDALVVHRTLGELINDKFPPPPNYDEQLTVAMQRHQELTTRRVEKDLAYKAVATNVTREDLNQLRQRYEALGSLFTLRQELDTLDAQLVALRQHHATHAAAAANDQTFDFDKQLSDSDRQLAAVQATRTALEQYITAWNQLQTIEVEHARLTSKSIKRADELPALRADLERKQRECATLRALVELYTNTAAFASKNKITECLLCDASVHDQAAYVSRLNTRADICSKELQKSDYREVLQVISSIEAEAAGKDLQCARTGALVEERKRQLAAQAITLTPEAANTQLDELLKYSRNLIEQRDALVRDSRAVADRASRAAVASQAVLQTAGIRDDKQRRYESVLQMYQLAPKTTLEWRTLWTETKDKYDANSARAIQASQLYGELTELDASIKAINATISVLETHKAQQAAYLAVTDKLNKVRDWFHYGNGPRALTGYTLNSMVGDINGFLDKLNAAFVVSADEDTVTYKYTFTDGRVTPPGGAHITALSVGQQTALAIAFRLAGYCIFANRMGLLTLDEPTAYLDARNVDNFCNLLIRLKDIARSMQLQIVLSTHEQLVIPHMDAVVTV